jgi:hypothetical protein
MKSGSVCKNSIPEARLYQVLALHILPAIVAGSPAKSAQETGL